MAKPNARAERRANPYYRNGKYWRNKSEFRKARKEGKIILKTGKR